MYSIYASNQDASLELLEQLKKKKDIANFLEVCHTFAFLFLVLLSFRITDLFIFIFYFLFLFFIFLIATPLAKINFLILTSLSQFKGLFLFLSPFFPPYLFFFFKIRLCKYPLLLRELMKNTPEEHPDHKALQDSTDKVNSVVNFVNEAKRKEEKAKRMRVFFSFIFFPFLSLLFTFYS